METHLLDNSRRAFGADMTSSITITVHLHLPTEVNLDSPKITLLGDVNPVSQYSLYSQPFLPTKLRLKIWDAIAYVPRVLQVESNFYLGKEFRHNHVKFAQYISQVHRVPMIL
jgi:hypothetical protein